MWMMIIHSIMGIHSHHDGYINPFENGWSFPIQYRRKNPSFDGMADMGLSENTVPLDPVLYHDFKFYVPNVFLIILMRYPMNSPFDPYSIPTMLGFITPFAL